MSESNTDTQLPSKISQKYVVPPLKKYTNGRKDTTILQNIVTEVNRDNITAKSCVAQRNSGKTVITVLENIVLTNNIAMAKLGTGKNTAKNTQRADSEVEEKERAVYERTNCKILTDHHFNSQTVESPLNSTRNEEPRKKYTHQDMCLRTDNLSQDLWSEVTQAKSASDKICRICLNQGSISIFKNKDSKLAEAIMTIGGVDISENDNYPKYLCKYCHILLVNAVLIREKAQRSDKIFRAEEKNTVVSEGYSDYDVRDDDDEVFRAEEKNTAVSEERFSDYDLRDDDDEIFRAEEKNTVVFEEGFSDYDVRDDDENLSIQENELYQKESSNHNNDSQLSNPEGAMPEPSTFNDEQDNGSNDIGTLQEYFVIDRNMLKKQLEQTIDTLRQNYIQMKLSQTKSDNAEIINNNDSTTNGNTMESYKQSIIKIVKVLPKKSLESKSTQQIDDYFGDNAPGKGDKVPTSLNKEKSILTLTCKDCDLIYNSWREYIRHNVEKHPERKKLPCPICQKDYSFSTIERHVYYHKHSRQCEICGKHFGEARNFNEHYRTHSTNFPFKCSSCPYRSRTERAIHIHMILHTGEKKYKCTICPKRFINSGNLKRHVMQHRGERPHKCETCNQAFCVKSDLTRHIQIVHFGIKRGHNCNICGKSFDSRKICAEHKHQVHNMTKIPPNKLPHYLKYDLMKRNSDKSIVTTK